MKAAKLLAVFAVLGMVSFCVAQDAPKCLTGTVVKVDGANVTVKAAEKEVVVATNDKTVVTIDGKEAKVADLKAGMAVTVTPDTGTATKIVATTPKPAE
jgi:ABC-type enterochelin transport system substrate-binding protein